MSGVISTETPLDGGLKKLLFKFAGTWSDRNVWPSLWKLIAIHAEKYNLSERDVIRRMNVL
jgi:hypothetical protein